MTGNNWWQMALENGRINGFTKVEPASFFSPICQNEKHARVFLQKVKLLSPLHTLPFLYSKHTSALRMFHKHTAGIIRLKVKRRAPLHCDTNAFFLMKNIRTYEASQK